MFADNLPGHPDNIRLSTSGRSLYVALFGLREASGSTFFDRIAHIIGLADAKGSPNLFDRTAHYPLVRKIFGEVRFSIDNLWYMGSARREGASGGRSKS